MSSKKEKFVPFTAEEKAAYKAEKLAAAKQIGIDYAKSGAQSSTPLCKEFYAFSMANPHYASDLLVQYFSGFHSVKNTEVGQ
jgi:hypothetical protein